MSDPLAALAPRSVWEHFSTILKLPRPSKREERIVAWVRSLAAEHGFTVRSDDVGNLVVVVPASPGLENAPIVILQGHLDMVCEKNGDVSHDFDDDPIRARVEAEWVTAVGTTLGADNGIGVAAALAAATDSSVRHGPLELLFTLDEETGLTGAKQLDPDILNGRILINLDSEEDGVLFVGCAGGADTHLFLDVSRQSAHGGTRPFRIAVKGLRGGHSGMEIHENRGNAVKLATRILETALDAGIDLELGEIRGGSKHNAIPREAEALIRVAPDRQAALDEVLERCRAEFRLELEGVDDGVEVHGTATEGVDAVLSTEDRDRLVQLLCALPHGVLGMSSAIPGLVETSSNLAAVSASNGTVRIVTSSRSSVAPTLRAVVGSIVGAARLAGARVEVHDGYPGWKPDMRSAALDVARKVYTEQWGSAPRVTAVHAGLECGLLGEKIPGLDMISMGPTIDGPHSPDERVHVPSVERFWSALSAVLERLAERSR